MNRCIIATIFVLCATSALARANPSLSFTWNSCTGPIQQASTGPGTYSLYVTVTGVQAPHRAYEAWFSLAAVKGDVPDAWRFDESGCQGLSAIRFCPPSPLDVPSLVDDCPVMWGKGRFLVIHGIRPWISQDPPGVPSNGLVFELANAYDDVTTPDPNKRYFLYRVDFDHANSVAGAGTPGTSCGGFENDIVIRPIASRCNWLTVPPADQYPSEVRFDLPQPYAQFGDKETVSDTTPAALSSWGSIKAQYRR